MKIGRLFKKPPSETATLHARVFIPLGQTIACKADENVGF